MAHYGVLARSSASKPALARFYGHDSGEPSLDHYLVSQYRGVAPVVRLCKWTSKICSQSRSNIGQVLHRISICKEVLSGVVWRCLNSLQTALRLFRLHALDHCYLIQMRSSCYGVWGWKNRLPFCLVLAPAAENLASILWQQSKDFFL